MNFIFSSRHACNARRATMSTTLEIPIELEKLPEKTRNYLIAKSSAEGISTKQLVHDLLDREADRTGFNKKLQPARGK